MPKPRRARRFDQRKAPKCRHKSRGYRDLRQIYAMASAALAGQKGVLEIKMPSGRVFGFVAQGMIESRLVSGRHAGQRSELAPNWGLVILSFAFQEASTDYVAAL